MNGLPAPQNIQVLKNSDQYLIFSCVDNGARCVYKMSYNNNDKLFKEMYRIQALANAYPSLRERLPAFLRHGTIQAGLHTGRAYFVQEHLQGTTFSHYIQTRNPSKPEFEQVVRTIVSTLMTVAMEHTPNPAYERRGGQWFKEVLQYECGRLQNLDTIKHIAVLPALIIDGQLYRGLEEAVGGILASGVCEKLDEFPSFISALGHWNFHGDNIIFEDAAQIQNFRVIDPDVRIDNCDPLFGLARFFYSFPHDTGDYTQYIIHSEVFAGTSVQSNEFRVTYLWPQVVYQHYAMLFEAVAPGNESALAKLDPRFSSFELRLRLELCMFYCLIRGVYANYEDGIEFIGGKLTELRNKSIYLYLQAVMYANRLLKQYANT